jgi:hypothetical protein
LKLLATIPFLASLLSTTSAYCAVVQGNLCPELISLESRREALEVQLSTRGIEPETLVNELEAYRAVTTFEASAWHYAQFVFREQKQIPTRQFFFGSRFYNSNELADLEKLLQEHGHQPILIAVGLDRSIGYAPTPASTRFVQIVSQLHRNTQVRLLVYSYWENFITRSLTELGIPSH